MRHAPGIQLAALLLAALASAAAADRKSEALLKRVQKAIAEAKTLQAEGTVTALGGGQEQSFKISVRLMKPNFARIRLTGLPGGDRALLSTGSTVYQVLDGPKQYAASPAPPTGESLGFVSHFSPEALFFSPTGLPEAGKTRHAGEKTVDGRRYEVLEVTSDEAPQVRKYLVGPSGLVEVLDAVFKGTPPASGDQAMTVWLKDVKVNVPMTPEEFAYTPPADFKPLQPEQGRLLNPGETAPDFQLPRAEGGQLALSDALKGKKAAVVLFWFEKCEVCRAALPELQKLYGQLREKGLEVIAVNAGDPEEVVRRVAREEKLGFPVVLGGQGEQYTLGRAYGVGAYPSLFVVGPDRKVVMAVLGYPELSLRGVLARLGVQ